MKDANGRRTPCCSGTSLPNGPVADLIERSGMGQRRRAREKCSIADALRRIVCKHIVCAAERESSLGEPDAAGVFLAWETHGRVRLREPNPSSQRFIECYSTRLRTSTYVE